ncbi:F169A protein, partial [Alopecoenas beccarii]|nr:F169A protein [Alopecoenas beccarii]
VNSVGERVVLYVLNRIIYRTQEMESSDIPFLCHGSNDYAKIMWKKGEAIGFYSVKPTGSVCSSNRGLTYTLPVMDTMFVRKKHREKDSGLIMLEDFVDSFKEDSLGLRYPLSSFIIYNIAVFSYVCSACKQYLEKYPGDHNLLWEVEGAGHWFQRTSIMFMIYKEKLKIAEASQKENKSFQVEDHCWQPAAVSEARGQKTELETQLNVDPNAAPVSIRTRSSHLKRPRIGKKSLEPEPGTSQRDEENALHVSESRYRSVLELTTQTSKSSEDFIVIPDENTVEKDEEMVVENEGQSASEAEPHVSPPEKRNEKEEGPSEPLNGEVTEETSKTSFMAEEEMANEVLSGESKLQVESQEEPLTLIVPLILEAPAKPSEDTVSEKVLNANDSEMLTEESPLAEGESTEEQQESEKPTAENAAASASEEPSDNGLPSSVLTEPAEESVSENVLPKTASSLEDQNEEAGHNSPEASALSQSSLVVVELEGVSLQQPSGQEEQKNQSEEHIEESEQMDQYTQTTVERAADSSSEEAEIEVPVVDRRNLRRKAKGYKGPPKKKGKPA